MSASRTPFLHNSTYTDISASPVLNNSSEISVPEGCVTTDFFEFVPWDNEDNVIPKKVDDITNVLLLGICLPLLFIVSFGTNIINMVVFYKHGLKERINACLFTLSMVDLLSVTTSVATWSDVVYMLVIGKIGQLGPAGQFFFRNHLIGLYGLVTSSQIVYSVIALERCLCITRPLLVKTFLSTKTTVVVLWTMVFTITVGSVTVIGPRYTVLCLFNPSKNSVSYLNYPTDFYFRHKFIMDFMYWVFFGFFFPGISFVSVTVCTIVTAVELKKLSQWRESVSSVSDSVTSRDVAITRVIIGTSILFISCVFPAVVIRVSSFLVPDLVVGGRYDNLAWFTRRFFILASAFNSTFNFFLYYAHGSKFRETTNHLFSVCYCVESSKPEHKAI